MLYSYTEKHSCKGEKYDVSSSKLPGISDTYVMVTGFKSFDDRICKLEGFCVYTFCKFNQKNKRIFSKFYFSLKHLFQVSLSKSIDLHI